MTYPVTLTVEYPERLSRLTTFFRLFMLIPQMFIIAFVSIAAWIILILSWFAILFTGKYPETFFNFMTWYLRWGARLCGYAMLLTDKYPPFSGREDTSYPIIFGIEPPGILSRLTTFFRLPIAPTPHTEPLEVAKSQGIPLRLERNFVNKSWSFLLTQRDSFMCELWSNSL